MATTEAQAQVMEATAAKFEATSSSLTGMLNGLMSQLEVLRSRWQGAGGRSFEQVRQQWQENQQKINNALLETATAVRTSGTQYTATDEQAQQRMATNNRSVDLPL